MRKVFLLIVLWSICLGIRAQQKVDFDIDFLKSQKGFYWEGGGVPVGPDITFSQSLLFSELPTPVQFYAVSKKGRINNLTPKIWVEQKKVHLQLEYLLTTAQWQIDKPYQYQQFSEQIEQASKNEKLKLIGENLDKIPAIYFLETEKEKYPLEVVRDLFQKIPIENSNSIFTKRLEVFLNAKSFPSPKIGDKIKKIELINSNNERQQLFKSDHKPKLLVLMASGCTYSLSTISLLAQFHELVKEEYEIVTVWSDKSFDIWQNYRADLKANITWTNLLDLYGEAFHYFDEELTPTFFVINPDGTIERKFRGYNKRVVSQLKALSEAVK
jgi:peroxiredoxin